MCCQRYFTYAEQVKYYPGKLGDHPSVFANASRAWKQKLHLIVLKEEAAVRGAVYPIRVTKVHLILLPK